LVLASDYTRSKLQMSKEMEQMRSVVDTAFNTFNMKLCHLEYFPPESFPEPPFYSYLYFSGNISKTHFFCSLVQDTFARLLGHFSSNKHCILWISGYFRTALGNMGKPCALYTWWRGLLIKNAHEQNLPVRKASLAADFVIEELLTSDGFLDHIEDFFSNHREVEDSHKALQSLRQGNKKISEFNIQFNTLLYTVELSELSKCEVYEAAINPKIIKLGINQGGWSELTNLVDKQAMAVKLAVDVNYVLLFNQRRSMPPPTTRIEYQAPPAAQLPSKSGPMEIDSILADGFSFQAWSKECTDREPCIRCAKPFN
jgi:hypothetical protein